MADKILYDTDVLIQNRDHLKADSAVFQSTTKNLSNRWPMPLIRLTQTLQLKCKSN